MQLASCIGSICRLSFSLTRALKWFQRFTVLVIKTPIKLTKLKAKFCFYQMLLLNLLQCLTSSLQDASTPNDKGQTCHCDVCKEDWQRATIDTRKDLDTRVKSARSTNNGSKNKSFEEVVLDKIEGLVEKPLKTRRRVYMKAKVLIDEEYLAELKFQEDEANKKK